MTDKIINFIAARCRWLALLCLVSSIVPLYILREAAIDNSIEVWLDKDSKEYSEYQGFLAKYGNEEFVAAAASVDDPLSTQCLTLQKSLADELKKIEYVASVLDLGSIAEQLSRHRSDWQHVLHNNPFFENLLLGQDKHTIGMIVWLKKIDNPAVRRLTVEKIESVFHTQDSSDTKFFLAGTPLMNVALDRGSQQASRVFLPIALTAAVIILFVMLRNTGAMIAVICAVGVTTLWTIGLLTVCGRTFNMVTVTLPSLIFILSLSSGIHISSRYLTHLLIEDSRYKALRTTLQEVFIPILLSSLTTSAGFASLMISDMQPVVDFGKFAAVGMILSLLFNIMIVPGMLLFLVRSNLDRKSWHYHWTSWIGVNMLNRRRYVLVASLLLLMVFAGISTRLRVESNVLKFFPKDAKITRDYDYIGSHLTGFYTIELDLTADAANGSRLFKEMSQLSETIETRPEAAKVLDYGKTATLFQDMTDSAFIRPPRSGEQNSFRSLSKHYMLKEDDKISMRISVLVRAMSSGEFYSLLEYIRQQAFETISMDTTTKITGVVPLLNAAQQTLINTQIQSLSIAAGVVMCLIGVFVGSFRAFIAAVLPNVLPIFGLFAIMAMLNIPLDAATVMIASVAIGIAVDDTIHFLSHYRLERASAQTTEEAVRITLNKIGRAITFTSVVATAGFMILCLAPFKPICYFGILASVTMVIAWVSDVFVLPACVSALGLWEKK